jgi:hypothetical protein
MPDINKIPGMPDISKIPGMPDINKIPGMDMLNVMDDIKKTIAEEIIKKIQENLPDKITDSITVKSDIYNKILLVIQAHLQSKTGKQMLLSHIDKIIQPEIDKLTNDNEINKRILKMIFKNTSSDISAKLIELIAKNTTDTNATNIPERFNTNISGIISDFSIWIDEKNKTGGDIEKSTKKDDEPNTLPENNDNIEVKSIDENKNASLTEILPPPPPVKSIEQQMKDVAIESIKPDGQSGGKTKKRTKNNKRKTLRTKQKRTKRKYRK